jgi:uncharacterized protein (DUF362 family)
MPDKLVSLVKGNDRKENIKKALFLIKPDLYGIEKAKNILIKPNLTALKPDYANTSVESVEAVIEFINDMFPGKKIIVGESSATAFYRNLSTEKVFEMYGYVRLEEIFNNVELMHFDDDKKFINVPLESVVGDSYIHVTKRVEEFDYKISIAVPKMHNYAIATFGIKNIAGGLVTRNEMSMIHGMKGGVEVDAPKTLLDRLPAGTVSRARRLLPAWFINFLFRQYKTYGRSVKMIHRNIVELAKVTWPELVILDGWTCMEGAGPVDGDPVEMKIAIASTDALKADGIGARVIGFDPEDIGYLYYLNEEGLGDYSLDNLVGDDLSGIKRKLKRHGTYDVQCKWK